MKTKTAYLQARRPLEELGGAVTTFSARAMELVRLTKKRDPERFANTALSDEIIEYLAKFFADLAGIRRSARFAEKIARCL